MMDLMLCSEAMLNELVTDKEGSKILMEAGAEVSLILPFLYMAMKEVKLEHMSIPLYRSGRSDSNN